MRWKCELTESERMALVAILMGELVRPDSLHAYVNCSVDPEGVTNVADLLAKFTLVGAGLEKVDG